MHNDSANSSTSPKPAGITPSQLLRIWLPVLPLAFLMFAVPSSAHAGTYVMHQCSASAPSVAPGWSTYSDDTVANTSLVNTCQGGGRLGTYAYSNGQPGEVTESSNLGSNVGLQLNVPANVPDVTIRSLKAQVIASSVTGDKAYITFYAGSNQFSIGELPYGSGEYDTNETWTFPQAARNFLLDVYCSTSNSSTTCDFPDNTAIPALNEMTLTLEDSTPPTIANTSGELASAAANNATVSGTQAFGFTATDSSGVVSATLTFTPKAGGTAATHSFDFSTQCTYESWNACPTEQRLGGYSWDTSALKDGTYSVDFSVRDAAGNETNDLLGTITAHNAPADSSPPVVLADGPVTVGTQLASQPGDWSAASGAGAIGYAYQWEDCNTQGSDCQIIPDANGATYTPAPGDIGHTLRLLLTATDDDGSSTATSEPTTAVQSAESSLGAGSGPGGSPPTANSNGSNSNNGSGGGDGSSTGTGLSGPPNNSLTSAPSIPPGSPPTGSPAGQGASNGAPASQSAVIALATERPVVRSYARRGFSLRGSLHASTGAPIVGATIQLLQRVASRSQARLIAHARTTTTGAFRVSIPAGPSRTVEVVYRAFSGEHGYAAHAEVSERVSAGVNLRIVPRHTSPTGTIVLSGTVQGPIPRQGSLIDLLVHYHGHWQSFGNPPHTNRHGHFKIAYTFQHGEGRFPFRVQIPGGQAGFPYTRGYSNIVYVTTG